MELITAKTTLEEFTSKGNWLVKDPKTGAVYRMHVMRLLSGKSYMYVIQSGSSQSLRYVRRAGGIICIALRSVLLSRVQCNQFFIE